MNLIDALLTGKPLRRPIVKHKGPHGLGWLGNEYVRDLITPSLRITYPGYDPSYPINQHDILCKDWEIDET